MIDALETAAAVRPGPFLAGARPGGEGPVAFDELLESWFPLT
jgi:hypothetical protein